MFTLIKKRKKMIVANGDSFTQEIYLDIKDRWTHSIGVTFNLAHGGGSHERVLKTSIEFLNSNKPKIYIIGWPIYNRSMLPLTNGSVCIINHSLPVDENTWEKHQDIKNFYYSRCYNEYYHLKMRLEYMIFLQNYCLAKKIKLLYFLSTKEDINDKFLLDISKKAYMSKDNKDFTNQGISHNLNVLKKLIQKINDKIWIGNLWYSMQEHTEEFSLEQSGHPGKEGSKHWSEFVKKYL